MCVINYYKGKGKEREKSKRNFSPITYRLGKIIRSILSGIVRTQPPIKGGVIEPLESPFFVRIIVLPVILRYDIRILLFQTVDAVVQILVEGFRARLLPATTDAAASVRRETAVIVILVVAIAATPKSDHDDDDDRDEDERDDDADQRAQYRSDLEEYRRRC